MKINLPITPHERLLADGTTLITTTDLKGRITSANAEFLAVSGFSEGEVIGASQNIVRHPHMPPATFDNLWQTIKSGKAWSGLVKNRCKNGDYYWVDAYVALLLADGEIIGYRSVHTLANAQRVARAERLYEQMRNGMAPAASTYPLLPDSRGAAPCR